MTQLHQSFDNYIDAKDAALKLFEAPGAKPFAWLEYTKTASREVFSVYASSGKPPAYAIESWREGNLLTFMTNPKEIEMVSQITEEHKAVAFLATKALREINK